MRPARVLCGISGMDGTNPAEIPSVDLALVGEWKQVEAEMMVGRNKRVEAPPHFIKIAC